MAANYGFVVALPWANNRVQGVEDFDSNPGAGLTDTYVQPIELGWTRPRADFSLAYGLYIPTGRYEDGADNNTGLGMWAQELLLGTTVYLNKQRSVHAATTATFDFQSKKKDSETKVGNIMNLEGGIGADFLRGGLTTGLAYYGTFKLTDDQFDARLPSVLIRGKNRVWGLGPEVTLAIATQTSGLRLRDRALPVGDRRTHDDRRRRLEHPGVVPAQAHQAAMTTTRRGRWAMRRTSRWCRAARSIRRVGRCQASSQLG